MVVVGLLLVKGGEGRLGVGTGRKKDGGEEAAREREENVEERI